MKETLLQKWNVWRRDYVDLKWTIASTSMWGCLGETLDNFGTDETCFALGIIHNSLNKRADFYKLN